ncbi:hypothetical protein M1D70_05165 [Paenibacillus sp. AK002]
MKEYLLAMRMLTVPLREKSGEHAGHQEMIANLLFELGQEWGSTRVG